MEQDNSFPVSDPRCLDFLRAIEAWVGAGDGRHGIAFIGDQENGRAYVEGDEPDLMNMLTIIAHQSPAFKRALYAATNFLLDQDTPNSKA